MTSETTLEQLRRLGPAAYEVLSGREAADVFGRMIRDSDPALRETACRLLTRAVKEEYGSEEACDGGASARWLHTYVGVVVADGQGLRALLADAEARVRGAAVEAFAALSWAMTDGLIRGPEYALRREGSRCLCADVIDEVRALRSDDDTSVRAAAIIAVGRYEPMGTTQQEVEHAASDEAALVRLAAVKALHRYFGPASGDAVARALGDTDAGVRTRARGARRFRTRGLHRRAHRVLGSW